MTEFGCGMVEIMDLAMVFWMPGCDSNSAIRFLFGSLSGCVNHISVYAGSAGISEVFALLLFRKGKVFFCGCCCFRCVWYILQVYT